MKPECSGMKSRAPRRLRNARRHRMSRCCDETGDLNLGNAAWKGSGRDQFRLGLPRRDFRAGRAHEYVDLAPNAEGPVEVDARLHREADAGDQQPVVVRLVIVQMRSRPVEVPVDGVAGTVNERVTEAGG